MRIIGITKTNHHDRLTQTSGCAIIRPQFNTHTGCPENRPGEKGSRCQSGATAITVFCDADADVIERKLEKAQPQENCSTQSARRPAMYDQRIFSGKWRKRALFFAGTVYLLPNYLHLLSCSEGAVFISKRNCNAYVCQVLLGKK